MKRIIISAILTAVFAVGTATSFVVNDMPNFSQWIQTNDAQFKSHKDKDHGPDGQKMRKDNKDDKQDKGDKRDKKDGKHDRRGPQDNPPMMQGQPAPQGQQAPQGQPMPQDQPGQPPVQVVPQGSTNQAAQPVEQ